MENQDGLHILKAEIQNFKNITFREVEFDGRSIIIAGRNQIGKSSLIQAICSPVNSKFIPIEPIKQGEEKGHTEIVIGGKLHGEEVKYTIGCYFSQEHQKGRLTLQKNGTPIKGGEKSILKDIIGDISFDIMSFVRMGTTENGGISKEGVRKQIEVLKKLMPQETLEALFKLDTEKQEKYDSRTEINREIKYLDADVQDAKFSQEEILLYSEPLDAADLSAKIENANKINNAIDQSEKYIKQSYIDIPELDEEIKILKSKIEKIEIQKEEIQKKSKECSEFLAKKKRIDTDELSKQMNSIAEHNTNHAKVKETEVRVAKLREKKDASEQLSIRLNEIEAEKKKLFAESKMPVKGLAFDEEMVTYNDLPLCEEQLPTSQLIGIGLKIGMALNPNLKLLVIKDGSLLDNKTMEYILKMCDKHNYQLLIEVVRHEGDDLTIEFIEK